MPKVGVGIFKEFRLRRDSSSAFPVGKASCPYSCAGTHRYTWYCNYTADCMWRFPGDMCFRLPTICQYELFLLLYLKISWQWKNFAHTSNFTSQSIAIQLPIYTCYTFISRLVSLYWPPSGQFQRHITVITHLEVPHLDGSQYDLLRRIVSHCRDLRESAVLMWSRWEMQALY